MSSLLITTGEFSLTVAIMTVEIPSGQYSSILPARVASAGFGSFSPLTELGHIINMCISIVLYFLILGLYNLIYIVNALRFLDESKNIKTSQGLCRETPSLSS